MNDLMQEVSYEELQAVVDRIQNQRITAADCVDPDEAALAKERAARKPSRSPVVRFLQNLPPGTFMTTQQVADKLGVSASLIRKIARREEVKAPSTYVTAGSFKAYLYNQEDLEEMKKYVERSVIRVLPND